MIEIEIHPLSANIGSISIENKELIKAILSMPDKEYYEILSGIVSKEKLNIDTVMRIFAICWKILKKEEMNPAQKSTLCEFINQLYTWNEETKNKNRSK